MISRRVLLIQALFLLAGCAATRKPASSGLGRLTIGTVAYDEGSRSVEQYQRFISYVQNETSLLIQLEPTFNEVQALGQIQRQAWDLVFAPPGLAAIAISKAQYLPIFPLQGINNLSSVLVVLDNSPIASLADVNGKVLALGQPGSATGYYVPLYELYGTTPASIRISPTPKTTLEWLAQGDVAVGALSKDEFDRHRATIQGASFRILHNSRRIPSGAVLISPRIERNQQELIQTVLNNALPAIAEEVGYVPNAQPPDYKTLVEFIDKVKPIEANIQQSPAPLYSNL